jgi:hypothetical protein
MSLSIKIVVMPIFLTKIHMQKTCKVERYCNNGFQTIVSYKKPP